MKKIIALLVIPILLGIISVRVIAEENKPVENQPTEEPIKIVIDKTLRPRTPDATSPITGYYQNGVVYLQFSEDMGCFYVDIANTTTGESWNDYVCSDCGTEMIPVSTSHGNYTLTLVSESNGTFYGTFSY